MDRHTNIHPHTYTHTLSSGDIHQHRVIVYRSIAVITFTGDEHGSRLCAVNTVYPQTADFTGYNDKHRRQILSAALVR